MELEIIIKPSNLDEAADCVQQRIFQMRRAGRTVSANTRPVTINVA